MKNNNLKWMYSDKDPHKLAFGEFIWDEGIIKCVDDKAWVSRRKDGSWDWVVFGSYGGNEPTKADAVSATMKDMRQCGILTK